MKSVEITVGFTGYPNGKKRQFAPGETPELANDYADLIIGKDLAREKPDQSPTPTPSNKGGKKETSHEDAKPQD